MGGVGRGGGNGRRPAKGPCRDREMMVVMGIGRRQGVLLLLLHVRLMLLRRLGLRGLLLRRLGRGARLLLRCRRRRCSCPAAWPAAVRRALALLAGVHGAADAQVPLVVVMLLSWLVSGSICCSFCRRHPPRRDAPRGWADVVDDDANDDDGRARRRCGAALLAAHLAAGGRLRGQVLRVAPAPV